MKSCGLKLKPSTFHSPYRSAGNIAYGWQPSSALIALRISAGPLSDALPSIKSGSLASVPCGVMNARNVILMVSEGAIELGSVEHVFSRFRNWPMRLVSTSTFSEADASKSSSVGPFATITGSVGGRPSKTLYLSERSGSGCTYVGGAIVVGAIVLEGRGGATAASFGS